MKYNEDKILKEIFDYIKSTYGQHYSTGKGGFQVQDLFKIASVSALRFISRSPYHSLIII
jgi:hypothetical protein